MEIGPRIQEIKEIKKESGKKRGMAIVRMEDKKGKLEIMKNKTILRDEGVRIEND